jgi:hypothetical protein
VDDVHEAIGATNRETLRARGALKNAAGAWELTWLT